MKNRLLLVSILVVGLLALVAGTAAAQDRCWGDVINYRACFVGGDLRITRIEANGQGYDLGVVPHSVFAYAAASYDSARYVGRLTAPRDGAYVDLYYSYKTPSGSTFQTFWEMSVYNAAGVHLATASFDQNTEADASVPPAFASAAPAPAGSAPAATTTVVGAAYSSDWEPAIVQPGSVNECLVRNTFTVRMRVAPTTIAPVLDRVPFDTAMPSDLRTTDGAWYRAFFVSEGGVGRLGWIDADYLSVSEACAEIGAVAPLAGEVSFTAAPAAAPAAASGGQTQTQEAAPVAFDPTWGGRLDLSIVEGGSVNQCLVRNTYTVRIRMAPSDSAPVLDTVPYNSSMPADLRTTDGAWMRANYLGSLGWIAIRYLDPSDACANLGAIRPIS